VIENLLAHPFRQFVGSTGAVLVQRVEQASLTDANRRHTECTTEVAQHFADELNPKEPALRKFASSRDGFHNVDC
jgi:hypothetical protein